MRIRVGVVLGVMLLLVVGCGGKDAMKCVEGQSSACACPSGGTGAQVCTPSGAFGACACESGVAPAATVASRCTLDALKCPSFSTQGLTGWQLHKLVFDARGAKRFDEAVCLAQNSIGVDDKALVGASHYEASYAWEGLGCREQAVAAIEQSVRVRPKDKNGWKETCARCAELKADCALCKASTAKRVECPSMSQLQGYVGAAMTSRAPSDQTWTTPKVEMCIPIALPQPGWYVIGWVQQEGPDQEFWFHLAVDARTEKVVAVSEPEQRKYNFVCDTTFGKVSMPAGEPSQVSMKVECGDKMGRSMSEEVDAFILPPRILLTQNKSTPWK